MTLGIALTTALSGLQAQQRQSAVISRNVANASTPGYTRKEAMIASLVLAGEGQGARVAEVRRSADQALARELREQAAARAGLAARSEALATYVQTVGQPQEERSVSATLAAFERAYLALGELPENPIQQRAVVEAAVALATRLNDADRAVRETREQADAAIAAGVADVNSALRQLERLNRDVAIGTGVGRDTTDLEDERDRLLDRIAEQVAIRSFTRGANELVVLTVGGATLLDGTARQLQFSPTTVITPQAGYPGGGLSGLTVDGVDIAPGGGAPTALRNGRLAGLFDIRDRTLPRFQRQLDETASVLAERFQALDASLGPADAGLFTDLGGRHARVPPFPATSPGPLGFAGRIRVNDAVRTELGGDPSLVRTGLNGNALPVGDTTQVRAFLTAFDTPVGFDPEAGLLATTTLAGFAAQMVGFQQVVRADAEAATDAQTVQLDTVRIAREGRDGVNIDDELQKLLLVEKAFAAGAQVIQAATRMLDELLAIA